MPTELAEHFMHTVSVHPTLSLCTISIAHGVLDPIVTFTVSSFEHAPSLNYFIKHLLTGQLVESTAVKKTSKPAAAETAAPSILKGITRSSGPVFVFN